MTAEPTRESDGQASIDVAFTPADVEAQTVRRYRPGMEP